MPETNNAITAVALPVPLTGVFHYLSEHSLADGIRVRVPFGHRELIGITITTKQQPPEGVTLKPILEILDEDPIGDTQWHSFIKAASSYYINPIGESYHNALPQLLREGRKIDEFRAPLYKLLDPSESVKAKKQQEIIELLKVRPMSWDQLREAGAAKAALNRLLELEIVAQIAPACSLGEWSLKAAPLTPTDEQQQAIAQINSSEHYQAHLLFGITGSGKTEVFLQTIAHTLKQGKQVLVLVPEISLTPQTVRRFADRFNAQISTLHSGLAKGLRTQNWVDAHDGRAHIIIGTRSAIFSHIPKLGLIIVDEEHDLSYKQQDGFRYSSRDLAVLRAKQSDIPVVLGSATPSFESFVNAQHQRYRQLNLTQRATGARLPEIKIVDTRQEAKDTGFTQTALTEIYATLQRGEQALVFINRRGYSPVLMCEDCGWIAECKSCTRNFTVHRKQQRISCHHCDIQHPIPHTCIHCKGQRLSSVGEGTERCEERLTQLFPDTPVVRIDRDTASSQRQLKEQLDIVDSGEPCILVGTQMLAKGHHFAKVTLVLVVDIDAGLYSADFRSAERTGQLMTQVTGRAGRAALKGHVVIQTALPDHPLLLSLVQDPYEEFARRLIAERARLNQPPYSAAALVRTEHPHFQEVMAFLERVNRYLAPQMPKVEGEIFGPQPAPLEMRNGRFRGQLWVFAKQRQLLHHLMRALDREVRANKLIGGLRWSIDIDPQDHS